MRPFILSSASSFMYLLFALILSFPSPIRAQSLLKKKGPGYDRVSAGIGIGPDYGGLGANLMVYPQRNIALFAGGGYALAGFGYNAGAKLCFRSERVIPRANCYLLGMYGYNTAVIVSNKAEFNKFFYGPTLGFGIDTRHLPWKAGYWAFALLFPMRSQEVDEYVTYLKEQHKAELSDFLPFSFSIGYRLVLQKPAPKGVIRL